MIVYAGSEAHLVATAAKAELNVIPEIERGNTICGLSSQYLRWMLLCRFEW
jgi:hypothetical protein